MITQQNIYKRERSLMMTMMITKSTCKKIKMALDYTNIIIVLVLALALILLFFYFFSSFNSPSIYLLDFSCYRPPPHLRASTANYIEHFEIFNVHEREAIDFQTKMTLRSGIGPDACHPLSLHQIPPDHSLTSTQDETEAVVITVVKDLLTKHSLDPRNIDIIVTNCTVFCPTPSITAMMINKFGFRSDVKSVNLSGMGCSASVVAIGLVKDLLRVHHNSLAMVVSIEAVTPSFYSGNIKSMLLANTLFRMGGVAVLLSNKEEDQFKAKYKLKHLLRTHMGSDDQSYKSVIQQNDEKGNVGILLSRSLPHTAGNALKTNVTELGPLCLPLSEQIMYGWSIIQGKLWKSRTKKETYVPNFKRAFEHFCIHAGGKAIVDGVEERLRLNKEDGEASRMTLYRFGNTSSSSIWYELSYHEAKGRVRKGDKVWQIAFGSGFKCNSAVWECVSQLDPNMRNAWSDDIYSYPKEIPEIADH